MPVFPRAYGPDHSLAAAGDGDSHLTGLVCVGDPRFADQHRGEADPRLCPVHPFDLEGDQEEQAGV